MKKKKKISNNIRFILIMMILKNKSFNNEGFNYQRMKEEISRLNNYLEKYDVEISESTYYRILTDFEVLMNLENLEEINPFGNIFGELISNQDGNKKFYSISSLFEPSEVRILFDLINSSKSISLLESERLLEKVLKFHGSKDNKLEKLIISNRNKTSNNIGITLNNLLVAIEKKRKVSFNYCTYIKGKGFQIKENHKGEKKNYILNPIDIFCERGYYYVIFQKDNKSDFANYRIDRIKNLRIIDEEFFFDHTMFNLDKYIQSSLYLYTGNVETIELEFNKKILNYIVDELGENIKINSKDEGEVFKINFDTTIDEGLVKWVIGLGSEAKVLAPKHLVKRIKSEINKMIKRYK